MRLAPVRHCRGSLKNFIWAVLVAGYLWEQKEYGPGIDIHIGARVSVSGPGPTWELPEASGGTLTSLVPRETH